MEEMRIISGKCVEARKGEKYWIRVTLIEDGEHPGLDIREFVESERYTGGTKKGVRIPTKLIPDVMEMLRLVGLLPKTQGM